ncbi:MAG: AtpZ/AtpI family protein [Prolixibacteraceae bacterium]|nr:AtpZ/AtpI family protein [Prolixibacteraceae bacterium]
MKNQKPNKSVKDSNTFIRYSALGFEMMSIIGLGTFGGYKIDQWMGNKFKWFTLGLMILSVVIAIFHGTKNILKRK